ncbi:hypothetical protein HMPREF1554_00725 [Porphyromonas gingivalis F0569]|nr:hypothetical protein HMPREF1554_00725 [Porphyromonas gingivalis F0569]
MSLWHTSSFLFFTLPLHKRIARHAYLKLLLSTIFNCDISRQMSYLCTLNISRYV